MQPNPNTQAEFDLVQNLIAKWRKDDGMMGFVNGLAKRQTVSLSA